MTGAVAPKREGARRAPAKVATLKVAAPTTAQRAYLKAGLDQPGGKLPLFDNKGAPVPPALIRACIARGWAERWFENPLAPDWLVCRLTPRGAKAARR